MGIFVSKNKKKEEPKAHSNGTAKSNELDAEVVEYLEQGFKKLQDAEDCKSLLKKHLTQEVFDKIKGLKTPEFGSNLKDVIQSGVENLDSGIGIYAPDADAYKVFAPLFDPVIEEYHNGFKSSDKHPKSDFGDPSSFEDLDPEGNYVVSTRIRCGRSIKGFPFNPNMSEDDYERLENLVSGLLEKLDGDLSGKYLSLSKMSKDQQNELIDQHYLFKEGDRFLEAANALRYWPKGRGIFLNEDKTFLVWCGEEDHIRIISMQKGGNVGEVYGRLVKAVDELSKKMNFYTCEKHGFLTFCPTNLGNTIRASVHIKLPKLAAEGHEALQSIADKYQLQVRGSSGEHSEAEGGLYDISNRERMGLTEYEAVKKMYEGIKEMIAMEKEADTANNDDNSEDEDNEKEEDEEEEEEGEGEAEEEE